MAKSQKAKQEQKRAELAHQWEDREGNARPTPERKARTVMRLVDGADAGVKIAYDDQSTPLRDCFVQGKIDEHHVTAGERFEALCRANMGSPSPRSCLDWSPKGHDETVTEYAVRARQALTEATHVLGLETSTVLMDVCYFHKGTGPRRPDARRWSRFVTGLNALAVLWGLTSNRR